MNDLLWLVLVVGMFALNLIGLARLGSNLENHGCLLYVVMCVGLVTFLGVPYLLVVGVRSALREI